MSCPSCGEREPASGYDECRFCVVELIENGDWQLTDIGEPYRAQVLTWFAEVAQIRERAAALVAVPNLRVRQAS
jgi:hypothetical protein